MSGEERGRRYVRKRLWWLMETIFPSLKEFESHCFPSEQLRPIDIVLMNINPTVICCQTDIFSEHRE